MTQLKDNLITLSPCPHPGLSAAYETLFSEDALGFLIELVTTFDQECDKVGNFIDSKEVTLDTEINVDLLCFHF